MSVSERINDGGNTHTDCSTPPPPPPSPRSLVLSFSFHHNGLLSLLMAFFSEKRLSRFHTISPMIHQRSLVIGGNIPVQTLL